MMKKYTVQNQETGKKVTFQWEGEEPPTDSDIEEVFAAAEKQAPAGYLAQREQATQKAWGENTDAMMKSLERDPGKVNRVVAPIAAAGKDLASFVGNMPGVYEGGKLFGATVNKFVLDDFDRQAIANAQKAAGKLPEPVKNLASMVNTAASVAPGVAGVEAGVRFGPTMASMAGKKAAEAIVPKLEGAAGRIQGREVKINTPEFKKGASNELYTKYGVFGNAKQVKQQWQTKIDDTYNQVKDKIENSATAQDPENYTFINDVFAEAKKSAVKYGKSKTAIAKIDQQLEGLKKDFAESYPDGKINILDAQLEKQFVGKKGDWLSNAGKIGGNPEAALGAQAHNALYDALKQLIENKGSPGIKELNKQLSEMIPMERAASKQVLINSRKNPISLDDYIGGLAVAGSAAHGNLLPAALTAANVVSKSPNVAKLLSKTAKALKNQRGAVGGVSDDFVGTPAIRDPQTGKIYLGGWRGHKDAIIKGETSEIQERLKYQHFLDNSNKPTDNVGFIDKKGNFVSRAEAEAAIAKPKTPAQMYHDEWGKVGKKGDKYSALKTMAATGATAAGGLTLMEIAKGKKRK